MPGETISRMIDRAYGRKYNLDSGDLIQRPGHYLIPGEDLYHWYDPILAFFRNKWLQLVLAGSILMLTIITIYFYNILVVSEQLVLTAEGKVSTLMQRRNDISINLSKAVLDYSTHERNVFTGIVALRSLISQEGKKDEVLKKIQENLSITDSLKQSGLAETPDTEAMGKMLGKNPLASMDKLLAVAEQYPDLKLSSTFISLMTALVEVEKDLATERLMYNDAVNVYTTHVAKFPSNLYAWLFDFESKSYFEPTQAAKQLKPIAY